jgi:hypothetical protein
VQALRVAALWLVLAWIVSVCAAGLPYQRRA